jgi:TRAP-type C4-dicarboxylate transport system permease small subunit
MEPMRLTLARIARTAQESADFVSAILFAVVFVGFVVQVTSRYAFRNPLGWSSEAIMIVFMWAFFWAAAFSVPLRGHISLDIVYNLLPPQGRRWASIAQLAAIAVVFALALPATWDYVYFMRRIPTGALEIPFIYVFTAFPVFMAAIIVRATVRVVGLLLPGWERRIGEVRGQEPAGEQGNA